MQGGSARARRAVVVVAGVDLVSKVSETSYSRDAFIHPLRLVAKSSDESRQFVLGRFADFGVLAGSLPRTPTSFSRLRIASMASFRPNGHLYEGRVIAPDVYVEPIATDFILGGTDSQLDRALELLRR